MAEPTGAKRLETDPRVGPAVARLRDAFRRFWSWAVSDDPRVARIGQEYILEQADRVLWLVGRDDGAPDSDPFARLWEVRTRPHLDYPIGTRELFSAGNEAGYWGCFQALFTAAGLPQLHTFDGPFARKVDRPAPPRDAFSAIARGLPAPAAGVPRSRPIRFKAEETVGLEESGRY